MKGICLVPFGTISTGFIVDLIDLLSLRFEWPVTVGPVKTLPDAAFDANRNQYLAGAFLEALREIPGREGSKLLGVTEADIYGTGLSFVFGQAEVGGRVAVISLARLLPADADGDGHELLSERTLKEAVHELGHTFGLDHCRDRFCVMHFSTGIEQTDIKMADFCPRHAVELTKET